jgi:putative transposase
MPRSQRLEYENAWYHVMNRGRGRQMIFNSEAQYQAFLDTIGEAHNRFGIEIHAYCLMGNHYHLLVKTPRGNLSRCMRHINGLYTQRYNRLEKTDGPLFRGRFKAILVDQDSYLLSVTRYIHRNPIDLEKPLVKTLASYPWSSYPAYINKTPGPDWLYRDETYSLFGSKQPYHRYQRYVEMGGPDTALIEFYSKARLSPVLGNETFQEAILKMPWRHAKPEKLRKQVYSAPTIQFIIEHVAKQYNLDKNSVCYAQRSKYNRARQIALYLCHTHTDQSLSSIAAEFGLGHVSGVTQQVRRFKEELELNAKLRSEVNMLCQYLTP